MAKEENFNDVTWQKVDLPHDWSIRQQFSPTYASCMGYLPGGIGWYRKNLPIPAEKSGEKVYLYFEGIYNRSEVYINGHLLGKRPNGYISFLYDASSYIKYGEDNVIAVRKNKLSVAAGENSTLSTAFSVSKPHLWSIDRPYLYTLKTTLLKNGEEIDSSVTKTGFRSYTFDPNKGFALNGEWMKVKGVCLHHDAGVLGAAVPKDVWRQRFLRLKEIGCNAIRTSHNPQAPDFYDLCDEMGFLVMDEAFDEWEFPKRKWIEGWNVGTPGFDGSYDFFEEWGEQDLADMVRRDRNHISIFAWSIGNEVDYPNDPYSHPVLDGGGDTGFTQPIFTAI
jgi:beta-galactosidase/beta-glucuronidase